MKRMRIALCLFIIGVIFGCSGSGGPGAGGTRQGQNVVLSADKLISHNTSSIDVTPTPGPNWAAGNSFVLTDPSGQSNIDPSLYLANVAPTPNTLLVQGVDYSSARTSTTQVTITILAGPNSVVGSNHHITAIYENISLPSDQSQPAVAYDTTLSTPNRGRYMIVWTDSQNVSTNGTDILGAICTGSLSGGATSLSCGNPFPVSTAAGNQAEPKVAFYRDAVAANSRYLVIWTDSRGGFSQIYGQFLKTDGTRITTGGAVVTDNTGNFIISHHGNALPFPNATPRFALDTITYTSTNQSQPDLLYDAVLNRFIVAWLDINSYDASQIFRWNGANCSNFQDYNYVPLAFSDNNMIQSIEIDPTGASIIAGQADPATLKQVSPIAFLSPFAEVTTGNLQAQFSVQKNESKPKITYSAITGEYFTAWSGMNHTVNFQASYVSSTVQTVFTQNAPPGGWIAGSNFFITAPQSVTSATVTGLSPAVPITGITVTGFGSTTIHLTVNAGSNAIGDTNPLTITLTYSSTPPCAYTSGAFSDTDNDVTPRAKIRKTALGLVQDFSFGTIATSPALATDTNTNRVLVSWEENTGGASGLDVKGQLVDLSNFVNFGSTINISTATGDQSSPAASFDNANQRFFVIWEDARNQSANLSNLDVYGQFVDPQGNLSGANLPVTTAPGNQIAPAVAFGDINFTDFLVAWKDGRNSSDADIRGQLLQFSTAPQLLIKVPAPGFDPATFVPGDIAGLTFVDLLTGSINFGNINVGSKGNVPFKLCNNGNTQLTILPLNGTQTPTIPDPPYAFTVPSPVTISPGTCYDMNVNFAPNAEGSFSGNPANKFKTVINSDGGQVTIFFSGNGVGNQNLAVTTTSLPDASLSPVTYSATLTAFGGVFPYQWSIVPGFGTLPPGLTLDANTGVISGAATLAGTYAFRVQVTDNTTPTPKTAFANLSINVSLITITKEGLKPWTQGVEYSNGTPETMTATGGVTPYTWNISAGSLPPGISLNSATGALTGVPTLSGAFSFTVRVTDSSSPTNQSTTKNFSITINPPPAILTSSLPSGVVGNAYNQPINMSGGTSPFNWAITTGSLPPGLSIDSGTGVISGALTSAGTYIFTVTVTDGPNASSSRSLTIQVNSLINITTSAPAAGAVVGTAYTTTFAATGGTPPYTWGIVAGAPPDGLTLDPNTGILSGAPTAPGTFTFAVQVTDSATPQSTASKVFSITVATAPPPPGALTITTTGLTPWTAGVGGYRVQFTAAGGTAPYSWSGTGGGAFVSGLPDGLTLSSAGLLSGTPTTAGTFQIAVTVTDANLNTATANFNLTINGPLSITTTALPAGTPGTSYNQQLVLSGGTAPYNWSLSSGTLPPGLTLDSIVGTIKGTPTVAGTYNFTVKVADGPGATDSKPFTIQVSSSLSILTTSLPDTFINDNSYSHPLLASGGRAPFVWSVDSGVLPPGLALDANTGTISGTPTALGTYTFIIRVTDADLRAATRTFSITIFNSTDLFIAKNSLDDTFVNRPYTQTLTAVGGILPYTWSIIGNLPAGLSLDANTGILSGAATTQGTFSFTVKVTDSQGRTAVKTFSISVFGASDIIVTTRGAEIVSLVQPLRTSDLPPLPANFIMTNAVQFEIDRVSGQVIAVITFNSLPTSPVFYNAKNGILTQLHNCSSTSDTDCIDSFDSTNKKLVLRIQDNGSLDADPTTGVILDSIVAGYFSNSGGGVSNSGGGGGCSIGRRQDGPTQAADILLMLAPLFAIILMKSRRRKKK